MPTWDSFQTEKIHNCEQALDVFEAQIKIPKLFDGAKLADGAINEKMVVLYVSLLQQAFEAKARSDQANAAQTQFTSKYDKLKAEFDATASERDGLLTKNSELEESLSKLRGNYDDLKARLAAVEAERDDWKAKYEAEKAKADRLQEKCNVAEQLLLCETEEKTELEALKRKYEHEMEQMRKDMKKLEEERDDLRAQREAWEAEQKNMMDAMERFDGAKRRLEQEHQDRNALTLNGIEVLRKNLLEHLRDMNVWKDFLEQEREYKSETVQLQTEKAISTSSLEDQLAYLSDSLKTENTKLEQLLKEREIEEEAKKNAAQNGEEKKIIVSIEEEEKKDSGKKKAK